LGGRVYRRLAQTGEASIVRIPEDTTGPDKRGCGEDGTWRGRRDSNPEASALTQGGAEVEGSAAVFLSVSLTRRQCLWFGPTSWSRRDRNSLRIGEAFDLL
jgi:hypothetical protein